LTLVMCPVTIVGYAVGLPFGIRGVALSGAMTMLLTFPWVLSYGFRGTTLTLTRLGKRLVCPAVTAVLGVAAGECMFHSTEYLSPVWQILSVAGAFGAGCALAALIKPIRQEMMESMNLLRNSRSISTPQFSENLD
jgi:hypothetical protein